MHQNATIQQHVAAKQQALPQQSRKLIIIIIINMKLNNNKKIILNYVQYPFCFSQNTSPTAASRWTKVQLAYKINWKGKEHTELKCRVKNLKNSHDQ